MKGILDLLQFIVIAGLAFPVSLVPYSIVRRMGILLGNVAFFLWKSRRDIAVENIRKTVEAGCLPGDISPESVALESFRHLCVSVIEILKIYTGRGASILESVKVEGLEHFHEALRPGKGALIVTGHYGNWELMSLYFSSRYPNISVVARRQNNRYINSFIDRVRRKYGTTVIYKQGALRAVLSHLSKGGVVGILYDQSVIENEGMLVDFMCRKAWTMKIPVVLANKTGVPIVPMFIHRSAFGHTISIHPPIYTDREARTEEYLRTLNELMETHISADPTQWLWIHKRWKRTAS